MEALKKDAKRIKQIRKSNTIAIIAFIAAVAIAATVFVVIKNVRPIMQTQKRLDKFAVDLRNTAVEHEEVGIDAAGVILEYKQETGLEPTINWSVIGKIKTDIRVKVSVTIQTAFGDTVLKAEAEGKIGSAYLPTDYEI
jgi:hypothetical protein